MQIALSTKIEYELYIQLEEFCQRAGRTKVSVIDEALRRYLAEVAEEEKKTKGE
jgi:predicted DNA-binding protein